MEIKINEKPADITLESEKTIGDVLAGIEGWLSVSGHRLTGFNIDGRDVLLAEIESVFTKKIDSVKTLDVFTSTITQLTAQSLGDLLTDIDRFETLAFDEKEKFNKDWNESAQAKYILQQIPDLFILCINTFASGDVSSNTLRSIAEERLRETDDPFGEFEKMEQLVTDTCIRLVDLPLDIQTGKDEQAARTIQIFSGITEKIIRIYGQLGFQGYLENADNNDDEIRKLINEFTCLLKELLEAYEKHDSILIGDLAEYEAAPKLQNLYKTILDKSCKMAAFNNESTGGK